MLSLQSVRFIAALWKGNGVSEKEVSLRNKLRKKKSDRKKTRPCDFIPMNMKQKITKKQQNKQQTLRDADNRMVVTRGEGR